MKTLQDTITVLEKYVADLKAVKEMVDALSLTNLPVALTLLKVGHSLEISIEYGYSGKFKTEFKAWNGTKFTKECSTLEAMLNEMQGTEKLVDKADIVAVITGEETHAESTP